MEQIKLWKEQNPKLMETMPKTYRYDPVFFFSTYIGHLGGRKNDTYKIRGNISFSNLSNFVLRPFQRKNPWEKTIFSARCARR